MTFREWKAGDEAFDTRHQEWVTLREREGGEGEYPLTYPLMSSGASYTREGKYLKPDTYPTLLDHNPFDPSDPKNPKPVQEEFVLLEGKPFVGR